jgi:hypothetical protein
MFNLDKGFLMKKILLVSLLAGGLCACNSGGSSSNTSSDIQVFGVQGGGTGGNNLLISGNAINCASSMTPGGSCILNLTSYSGTGIYSGASLSLTPTTGYTESGFSSCPATESTPQSCSVTLTNAGTTTAQTLYIQLGESVTSAKFIFGN